MMTGAETASGALSRAEWQNACRQRAALYGWFSTLYAAELPGPALAQYRAGEARSLLEGLRGIGLAGESERLLAAIDSLRDLPYAHLELAADFAQSFLLDAKTGALPYASCYEGDDPKFCGPAEQRMRHFLAESSLALQEEFKEPADHLAIYLAVMVKVIEQQSASPELASDQAAFLRDALLAWLPKFAEQCQRVDTRFDFYPALATLLLAFVQQDELFLRDVAADGAEQKARL